jgi:hypothetical protein
LRANSTSTVARRSQVGVKMNRPYVEHAYAVHGHRDDIGQQAFGPDPVIRIFNGDSDERVFGLVRRLCEVHLPLDASRPVSSRLGHSRHLQDLSFHGGLPNVDQAPLLWKICPSH